MTIPENILSSLTDEQKKAVEKAQTPEELLAAAKESGYEMTQEQLDAVAGGWCALDCSEYSVDCPYYNPSERK